MDIVSGIMVYTIIWWLVFLMALPFGVRRDPTSEFGTAHGAPQRSHLPFKLMATTVITTILWFGTDALITANVIDFRELAKDL